MHLNKEDVRHCFYKWVYGSFSLTKFKVESIHLYHGGSVRSFMHNWHNHISPAMFAIYMESTYGHPFKDSRAIAKEVIAKKKLEELLNG